MYDIITIGSALVDVFIHSDHFLSENDQSGEMSFRLSGDKVDVKSFRVFSGGGGSNTAVGFSRLGFTTALVSETGRDDFSSIVINDLRKEKVSTSLIIGEKKEQTGGSVILVGKNGGRTALVHRGASSQLDTYDISPFWLQQTGWVHLSSIAGRKDTLEKIFFLLKKEPQIGLSWNPGKAELQLLAEKQIDLKEIPCQIFILNQREWQSIATVQADILQYFSHVIVTNGREGGKVFLRDGENFDYHSETIASVDDTGAGDAFATGYVAATIKNLPPKEAVQWGVRNASSVIKYYGAKMGLLRRRDIEV